VVVDTALTRAKTRKRPGIRSSAASMCQRRASVGERSHGTVLIFDWSGSAALVKGVPNGLTDSQKAPADKGVQKKTGLLVCWLYAWMV
jgi:hypothetical protein